MRCLPCPLVAALLSVALVAPAPSRAEPPPMLRDVTSVRAAGMAGATIGFAADTDAIHVNPAAVSAFPHFNAAVGTMLDVPHRFYLFSIAAVDSKLNYDESFPLAGALGYQYYVTGKVFDAHKGHVASLSLSMPLYTRIVFLGLTGRYFHQAGSVVANAGTMDAAAMVKLASTVGIAFAAYNIIDVHSREAPRGFGLGLSVGKDNVFHFDVDARLDKTWNGPYKPLVRGGGEWLIAGIVAPRLGYAADWFRAGDESGQPLHLLSAGVSLQYEGWGLDLSYQHAINGQSRGVGIAIRLLDV